MDHDEFRKILTEEQIIQAIDQGQCWGIKHVEMWQARNGGKPLTEPWDPTNFTGRNPYGDREQSPIANAYQTLVEMAASGIWDDARQK